MQAQRKCACPELDFSQRRSILRSLSQAQTRVNDDGNTITIPVVVNICFKTPHFEHYAAEVDWVIAELNKDFAKQASNFNTTGPFTKTDLRNTYLDYVGRAANAKIVFQKQTVRYKPVGAQSSGNLATLDSRIKGPAPAVAPTTTLNIWVPEMTSGILGYAQFPWDLASKPNTDGVVVARGCFGRCATYTNFNLNKTLTHEVGHWLGLYHTFQSTHTYGGGNIDYMDGNAEQEAQEAKGDLVVDTPPQRNPTYGNPLATISTWPTSQPTDETKSYRHMFMNFMDYSNDIALFMFTAHQSTKMRIMMYMYRSQLVPSFSGDAPAATEAPPAPEPTKLYGHNFENSDGWRLLPRFRRAENARLEVGKGVAGTKALALRRFSSARTTVDLSGANGSAATLKLSAKQTGWNARLYVRPKGSRRWRMYRIMARSNSYVEKTIRLPGPFTAGYRLWLRGASKRAPTYFDKLEITRT